MQVRELPYLPDKTEVWVTSEGTPQHETVIRKAHTPRPHIISTPKEETRRDWSQPKYYAVPEPSTEKAKVALKPMRRMQTRLQAGTAIIIIIN